MKIPILNQLIKFKIFNEFFLRLILLWLGLLFVTGQLHAEGESEETKKAAIKGFEIAARSDRSDRGFGSTQVKIKMVLRNETGNENQRILKVSTLEVLDESLGDKNLILFKSPPDIKGTVLLSHARILDADRQWLFMPALKRIKRISSKNKSGPFVGSEFSFEDFTALELNKFNYKYLRTEACGKEICDVVIRYPLYKYSGYTKQIAWIDQNIFQMRRVEFYDRQGAHTKTLLLKNYKQYKSKYWRSHLLEMKNRQTGKSTDFIYTDYKFSVSLSNKDFNKNSIKRMH